MPIEDLVQPTLLVNRRNHLRISLFCCFNIAISMADIAVIQLKIKAVEFALASFTKYPHKEEERVAFLDSKVESVRFLDVYCDFTKDELQDEKKQLQEKENLLQEKENLLLAQQQGSNCYT